MRIQNFTTWRDVRPAVAYIAPCGDEQVPLLRREARRPGAGDVLATRLAVRPRQRPDELRDAPAVEAPDRPPRARRAGTARARVLDLCCGSGDLCFLAEELGAGPVTGADFTLPDARRRAATTAPRTAAAAPSSRPTRSALPFPDGRVRRRHGQLRPAQRRGPAGGARGDAARARAGRPRRGARFRQARQRRRRARSTARTCAPRCRRWAGSSTAIRDTYLYIPESLERFPGAARRRDS